MNNFESKDAAEWLKKVPHSPAQETSSSRPSRNLPQFRTHTPMARNAEVPRTIPAYSPAPALQQPRLMEDVLIDLEAPEEPSKRKTTFESSNPFASLAFEESASSAESTLIHDRHGTSSPPASMTPFNTVQHGKQEMPGGNSASATMTQKGYSRASSSNFDDLAGLDPSFFHTPSSAGRHPSSGESAMADNPLRQSPISLLDEDLPPMKREEDEAWFAAQSGEGTAPAVSLCESGNISRRHFEQPGQLICPAGTPVTPSYRGRVSPQDRGNLRGHSRGCPRSRGGQRARGGRHGSHYHASQRSTHSYSGSEDTSGTVFQHPRGQRSTPGQGYGPRGSRGPRSRGTYTQANSRPIGENVPFVRNAQRYSRASSDGSEEASLATKVVDAIESGEKVQSLAVYHDTAATTEWRKKGMRPSKIIALPKNINLAGQNLDTKSSSRPAIARPAEIAMITNTHIDQVWGSHKDKKTAKLQIYGSKEAVEEAVKLIWEWLREIGTDHENAQWAKVWGFNRTIEKRLSRRLIRDEERRKYRQTISEGEVLAYSAQVVWALPKEPEQVLGMNFEALDPIRMNCACYITCEKGTGTIFKIQGNVKENVEEASRRLQCLPAEWYAKIFEAESFVVLDIPYALAPDDLPPISRSPYHLPRPLTAPAASKDDAFAFRFKHPLHPDQVPYTTSQDSPAEKLLEAVVETTQHARYFRYMLKLHLHLGTFAARKTQRPDINENTYSFPAFADMMEEIDKMDSKVSMEIGDPIVERHVLARCFGASHILAPQDAWTFSLSDVQPVYCATFEIANPASQAGDLILDVELSTDGIRTNIVSQSWSQLPKGKLEPRKLLDGNIISLQNGGLSWHLGMDEFMTVDERCLSPDYQLFPDTLKLDVAAANNPSSGHNFVTYRREEDQMIKVPIKSVRQKRCWRFTTLGSRGEWVVEVAQVGKTTIGNDGQETLYEPRWTFNVSNNNWSKLLTSNARAEIGQAAKWGPGDPANLLFPTNPDSSALFGVAKQDDEVSSEDSEGEDDNKADTANPEEPDDVPDEPPSLQSFEQLLDLLRALTDVAIGNPHSTSSTDKANELTSQVW